MDVFSRLLVAVDGSTASDAAVRLSLQLARPQPPGALRFVTTIDLGATWPVDESASRAALAAATASARGAGYEPTAMLRVGAPSDTILAEAGGWDASCIVMGAHRRDGPARALLGSSAEGVLRRSVRPVLVAHAAQTDPVALQRVLCAFDGSPAARRAFTAAAAFASEHDAELHVVSVVQLADLYATGYERDRFDPDGSIGALYDDARRELKLVAAEALVGGVRVAPHVVGGADVASLIVGCATLYGCGLVILGTHGRHGLGRAVLGSTAEAVIRGTAAPVLAFHELAPASETHGARVAIPHAR